MDNERKLSTLDSYISLMYAHQGGGFVVAPSGKSIDTALDQTAIVSGQGFKKFVVSIYNQQKNEDDTTLIFLVNPTDIIIGQNFISGDSYTREGWLSTLWGRGQPTILGNGSTTGFYVGGMGLTSVNRKASLSYRNFISILGMFKNNGYYFMRGPQNKDLFNNIGVNRGRVISVLDQIKISYDGNDYLGSFSSFSVDESVENPYRFTYNFEFIVSGLKGEPVTGHLKMCGPNGKCNDVDDIITQTSGNYSYDEIISLDTTNIQFDIPPALPDENMKFIESGGTEGKKSVSMPTGITKDPKKYVTWLQTNKDIPDSSYINNPKSICYKRKVVNKFFDSIKAEDIDKQVKDFATENGRGNYCFTNKETETIFMLESSFKSDGTWKKAPSSTGALGPAQIQPSTYKNIFKNNKDKELFLEYMKMFDYSAKDCESVKNGLYSETDPRNQNTLLHRDERFNYIVHKYIGFHEGGYTSTSQAQASNDVNRLAIVLTNYNGGTRPLYSNSTSIKEETAKYAKTGVYMQSVTTCP